MDGADTVTPQSIFFCEVKEPLPIVAREAAFCPKPHGTIRVVMDSIDIAMRQSIEGAVSLPHPFFELSNAEIDVFEGFAAFDVENLSRFRFLAPLFVSPQIWGDKGGPERTAWTTTATCGVLSSSMSNVPSMLTSSLF